MFSARMKGYAFERMNRTEHPTFVLHSPSAETRWGTMNGEDSELRILPGGRARWVQLPQRDDKLGSLLPVDFASLPFVPGRLFVVHQVPPGGVRGGHAHKSARQLLVCIAGRIDVELRDAGVVETVTLDCANSGLLIEAGVWAAQTYVEPATILLVLTSEPYDIASYFDDEGH